MSVRPSVAAFVLAGALALTGCSSSGGPHTQSLPPSASAPTSSSNSLKPTSSVAVSTSSPKSASPSSLAPTPTVTPRAQGAVNAYVADFNAGIRALREPAHAHLGWMAKYETGSFRTQDEQSFASLKLRHLAYRGAAPDPNIKVQSVLSSSAVILTSCQVVDSSDPWVQYDTKTGKAVPTGKQRTPPPPYLLQLFMKRTAGFWKVSSVVQNTSKTCKG